jgi:DNA-directed RNA polymerase specialized sigma24 family protein
VVAGADSVEKVTAMTPFASFYEERYAAALRTAFLLVGSRARAEDVVQEAFVALFRHWDEVEYPWSYLCTTMIRLARESGRRERRRQAVETLGRPGPQEAPPELLASLDRLKPDHRAAIVLRFYLDFADEEAAHVLGCSRSTIRTWIRRGFKQLRKDLSDEFRI